MSLVLGPGNPSVGSLEPPAPDLHSSDHDGKRLAGWVDLDSVQPVRGTETDHARPIPPLTEGAARTGRVLPVASPQDDREERPGMVVQGVVVALMAPVHVNAAPAASAQTQPFELPLPFVTVDRFPAPKLQRPPGQTGVLIGNGAVRSSLVRVH